MKVAGGADVLPQDAVTVCSSAEASCGTANPNVPSGFGLAGPGHAVPSHWNDMSAGVHGSKPVTVATVDDPGVPCGGPSLRVGIGAASTVKEAGCAVVLPQDAVTECGVVGASPGTVKANVPSAPRLVGSSRAPSHWNDMSPGVHRSKPATVASNDDPV